MIPVPSGVRVWLAVGRTDMRKGMNGLALQVQQALGRDPHAGDLYVFRGARGDLIKIMALVGLRGDGGTSHDQSRDESAKESFASAAGVVHELEEAEIQRQLLLRDAPVWPQPGT